MSQIQYTITDTELINQFGSTAITDIADKNGYFEQVTNVNYVPAQGDKYIMITGSDGLPTPELDSAGNPVPNPDYVPAVGTPTIANPETRLDFIARRIMEIGMGQLAQPMLNAMKNDAASQTQTAFDGKMQNIIKGVQTIVTE